MSVNSPNSVGSTNNSTYSYDGYQPVLDEKTINYLFDVSSARDAKALDNDLQSAILSIQNTDLSAQMQALIVDVMRLLATIRQQSMQNMQNESNLSLQTSNLTANAQRSHARSTANAEFINSSASMAQAMTDIGAQVVGMASANAKMKEIKAEGDKMDFRGLNADGSPSENIAPPAYKDVVKLKSNDELTPEQLKRVEAGIPEEDGRMANEVRETDSATRAVTDDPKAKASRAMWETNRARNYFQQQDMALHLTQALAQFGAGAVRMVGASETASAGESQAEATVYQALEHYLNSRQQISSGYANDMRDALSKVLQLIREAESARHASANQLANI